MFKRALRITPALIFWGVFIYVIFQVEYPKSLTQASISQLLWFFLPLFLALTFTVNFLTKAIPPAVVISLGLNLLLILKGLDSLNFVSAGLTILAAALLVSNFKSKPNLTYLKKLPKLKSLRRRKR